MIKLKEYFIIAIASILIAWSVALLLIPAQIVPGGVMGVSNILFHLTGISVGISTAVMTVSLLILGRQFLGHSVLLKTLLYLAIYSPAVDFFMQNFTPLFSNEIISTIVSIPCLSLGFGLILRYGGTLGGSDLLAKMINKKFRQLKLTKVIFTIDATVVATSVFVFGFYRTTISVGFIFVSMKLVHWIINYKLEKEVHSEVS